MTSAHNIRKSLYKIGGVSALLQLATVLAMIVAMSVFGPRVTSFVWFPMLARDLLRLGRAKE